jgi:hypothetical protein
MFDSSPVETESHANAQGDEGAKNLNTVWHEAKNCLVTTPAARPNLAHVDLGTVLDRFSWH